MKSSRREVRTDNRAEYSLRKKPLDLDHKARLTSQWPVAGQRAGGPASEKRQPTHPQGSRINVLDSRKASLSDAIRFDTKNERT